MLDFTGEEEARYWNKSFSAYYYSEILPAFSSLLDKYIPEDRSCYIDRLKIDLGTVHIDEFRTAFLKKTETELRRILKNGSATGFSEAAGRGRAAVQDADGAPAKEVGKGEGYGEDQRHGEAAGKQPGNAFRIKERKADLLESFYYFLDHGVLPWNSPCKKIAALETGIRQQTGLAELTGDSRFQKRLRRTPVRKRLCFQFSGPFVEELFNRLYRTELAVLASLREILLKTFLLSAENALSRKKIRSAFRKRFRKNVIIWIGTAAPADTGRWPDCFAQWFAAQVFPHLKPAERDRLINTIVQETPSSALTSRLKAGHPSAVPGADPGKTGKSARKQSSDTQTTSPDRGPAGDSPADTSTSPGPKEKTRELTKTDPAALFDKGQKNKPATSLEDQKQAREEQHDAETDKTRQASPAASLRRPKEAAARTSKSRQVPPPGESPKQPEVPEGDQQEKKDMQQASAEGSSTEPSGSDTGRSTPMPDATVTARVPGLESQADQNITPEESLTDLPEPYAGEDEFTEPPGEPGEYYLLHAGIILSWPYLSPLFKRLGYLRDQTFKEPLYQQRAIHLLGYIATGQEQREEHELVLAKFLCAWPLQMPVVKELKLTGKEKKQADQMLNSLVTNWPILKNTSVEGLRSSFFSRDGKLFQEEEQWKLIVEQKSYDMLLDHLPYTIAVIKLPWMKDMLKVDWA